MIRYAYPSTDADGKSVEDDKVSAYTNISLYVSGIINPYWSSTYPSTPTIADPSSRTEFSENEIASIQLLFCKYWTFHLTGVVLFAFPNNGSGIDPELVVNGPRSMSPTLVCTFTIILFAGTCSLYTTNGAVSFIKYNPLDVLLAIPTSRFSSVLYDVQYLNSSYLDGM